MAVCGRCLICGYKFNGRLDDGTAPDEAVRWTCAACPHERLMAEPAHPREHAICTACHAHLIDDETISAVAQALLAMVRDRVMVADEPPTKNVALTNVEISELMNLINHVHPHNMVDRERAIRLVIILEQLKKAAETHR